MMTNPVFKTIESAQITALNLLKDSNRRLIYFLENPFIPKSEKERISDQVFENMIRIAHLEEKYLKDAKPEHPSHAQ